MNSPERKRRGSPSGRSRKRQEPRRSRSGLSRFDLYELAVQNPRLAVGLLWAIHGSRPRILGEDFCGTAALSRQWVRDVPRGRAVAIDLDPEPLAAAKGVRSVTLIRGDVRRVRLAATPWPDVIFVGNFSIGEIHDRAGLVAYLRRCRRRLAPRGVFVADTYGGATAFTTGSVQRMHPIPDQPAARIRYTWQQRRADPLTGMVENAIHFRVERDGVVEQEITDAFIYRWRLWSVPELSEAMTEAGFKRTEVYASLPDAQDDRGDYHVQPVTDPGELGDSFIVCVAGRK